MGPLIAKVEIAGPFKVETKSCDIRKLASITARKELMRIVLIWSPVLIFLVVTAVLIWLARKKWPWVTVLLYTLWVTVFFTPIVFFIATCFGGADGPVFEDIWDFFAGLYGDFWPFWIFSAILIVSQMLLLIIPVRIVKERPKPQRSFWVTAIAAGALFAMVALGMVWSVVAAVVGDGSLEKITFLMALIFLLVNWIAWSWLFRSFARIKDPHSYIRRLMKWLLRGTILELLIAVPSHIIVRHRDVCCAHGVTALGIATGLAVMLISFGPGIYFLYAQRIESKRPEIDSAQSSEAQYGQ